MVEVMPTAGVTAPQGFLAAGVSCGLKKKTVEDLALLYSETEAAAAAVYTQNKVQAAPIHVTREHLRRGRLRAVVINSGAANACTGPEGVEDARQMARWVGEGLGIPAEQVAVASTGVIGIRLPMAKIREGIATAVGCLSPQGGEAAARAIMTTDTRPKRCALRLRLAGKEVVIGGMAKGSGMIHPNLATMLAFLTTDAWVDAPLLQELLRETVAETFNMITVDGDTSTNDMVLIIANGRAGVAIEGAADLAAFREGLLAVAGYLAAEIARDGEGATRLIRVCVEGAPGIYEARLLARTVAGSNLVKTAIYGQDPNWGRVLAALGYAPVAVDLSRTDVFFGPVQVAAGGAACPFAEEAARAALAPPEVQIRIALHQGEAEATALTCDLTEEYIRINAHYRS